MTDDKMNKTSDRSIEKLFPISRISSVKTGILIFLYIPIGILLLVLRLCLSLNFVIAYLLLNLVLARDNAIFKVINRIFMAILGIWVKLDGGPLHANVIVCNKRSSIDGIIFNHSANVYSEDEWGLPSFLCKAFYLARKTVTPDSVVGKVKPTVIFPEGSSTSGIGIMRFKKSYFADIQSFQSSAIMACRVLPVRLSTARSEFWSDLFWTFFCPMTLYTITFSKTCTWRDDTDNEEFGDIAASGVAQILNKPVLAISHHDKEEYLKRLRFESSRAAGSRKFSMELLNMATKVQEVTPHCPSDVILNDLAKTECVDVTIMNILEGVVKFTPIDPRSKQKEKPKKFSQSVPQNLLAKRKAEMYELARKRYKERHGL